MAATVIPFPTHRIAAPTRIEAARRGILGCGTVDDGTVSQEHEPRLAGVAILRGWFRRWAARRALAHDLPRMTDEALADIGLSRRAAEAEARRPFWRTGAGDAA